MSSSTIVVAANAQLLRRLDLRPADVSSPTGSGAEPSPTTRAASPSPAVAAPTSPPAGER
jgi:hypothetical protein